MAAAGWAPVQSSAPPIALISSRGADDLIGSKGFISISQLLSPFTNISVNVRDPSTGLAVSSKINLDIRDLRKEGYLLSHTVLPHVLHEALQSPSGQSWSTEGCLKNLNDALALWIEPVEQETFRSYLSSLFFVSTRDENPLANLSQLIQLQHAQQHASRDAVPLAPSHCGKPIWTTPTTLKHYVILYEPHDEDRCREIFSQMCSTYGIEQCSQLRLESVRLSDTRNGDDEIGSPDPWASRLYSYRMLESGLERARLSLIEKAANDGRSSASSTSPPLGITTISSSYSISSAASASPSTVLPPPPPSTSMTTSTPSSHPLDSSSSSTPSPTSYHSPSPFTAPCSRRHTTQADKDAIARFLEDYAKNNLVPHVERLMRTLNEQVANRRGISRSLTSGMRKWFGGGGGNNGPAHPAPITYSSEAPEMQQRRLADLAFLFGLHSFAYSQYQLVKKEFAADHAALHNAFALEMSALSLHLAQPHLTAKQYPVHYIMNALTGLIDNGARWPSLLRAGLTAWRIYTHLEMHVEAAAQLVRLTSIDNDACVGVVLWLASSSFDRARMHRKQSFYRFLAAHRFGKAGLSSLALAAYADAFPEYVGKGWTLAEERLALELSSASLDARQATDAATRLLLCTEGRIRDAEEEANNLAHYGRVRVRHAAADVKGEACRSIPLPLIDSGETRVIRGERPLTSEVIATNDESHWIDMERAAFHAVAGTSTAFRPTHIVSDADTDNQKVRETPIGERFRVQLRVRNPLSIPITLREVRLGVEETRRKDSGDHHHHSVDGDNDEHLRVNTIDCVNIQGNETKMVELWVQPGGHVAEFCVRAMRFSLVCAPGITVVGEIPLEIRGKRLNKTPKQMKSIVYAIDDRLKATVSSRPWPLIDVKSTKAPTVVYTDQLITVLLDVTNSGNEEIDGFSIVADAVDRVTVSEEEEEGLRLPWLSIDLASTPGVRAFPARTRKITVGGKRKIVVELRAPSSASPSHSISLLLLYRGVGGAMREWRTRITCKVVQLLQMSSRVLDGYHGLVALSIRNSLTSHDAALARVECTRVRVAVASRKRGHALMQPEHGLAAVRSMGVSQVRLESGQTEEVCVRISAPEGIQNGKGEEEDWTLVEGEKPPQWPLPVPKEDEEHIEWGRRKMMIGVAWKANIVGNDGLVFSLVGESFLPDPFTTAGLHVAGLSLGFSLSSPGGVASPLPPHDINEDGIEAPPPSVYLSSLPLSPFEHDFSAVSLCEFPLTIVVRNEDIRSGVVEMKMRPKVRETSIPPPRHQWWLSRECVRVTVPPTSTKEIHLKVRVTQPSAYDLLGTQMTCTVKMEGDEKERSLRIPPTMGVVYNAYGGSMA